ncbi:cation diffusion facilitator family transporter [Candidatus Halobonum tyrrellensis]|uniref:Cation diffusion facilitator family transporter n=1 Tax=Candidatus Halobonum tyrrellensis G22 TaxID=1324957 RepID=V4HEW4_9EURY|nr:cation diffusion facilitator family transporter [Candidatus Halobonum tyrrellensis]ESP88663.1 cation diffusion facilitator family transporter [Candidatus Halobonum tyrrellensis G22]
MAGSKSVVIAALVANGAIAILKFLGYLLTGSSSMLSETYHSISDTGNQVFLLIGIRSSGQEPSQSHQFGYGKSQFFYSFLVSVLLFGIAGWESLKHGYTALTASGHGGGEAGAVIIGGVNLSELVPVEPFWVNVAVLLGAILFESYAFKNAYAELTRQIREYGWSGIPEAFRQTSDVTTLTAFTEDAIALGGAGIALVALALERATGDPVYDAAGSVLIGLLLMGFAVALAWENKRLIVGESLPASVETELRGAVQNHRGVTHVDGFRTMFIGPGKALVTADVSFDTDLDTGEIDEDITQIEAKLREVDDRIDIIYIEPEL